MKFGKTAQLILAIGIFAIAIVFLYRMNQERSAEYEELNTQLTTAQGLLPGQISESEQLESQLNQLKIDLNQAKAELSSGKASFPSSIDSIRYDQLLYQMAHDRGLEMMRLDTAEPVERSVEGVTFTMTNFSIVVKGTVADILDFVGTIAIGDDFNTANVDIVSISIPNPVTKQMKEGVVQQEGEEAGIGSPSADIELTVYSYRGE